MELLFKTAATLAIAAEQTAEAIQIEKDAAIGIGALVGVLVCWCLCHLQCRELRPGDRENERPLQAALVLCTWLINQVMPSEAQREAARDERDTARAVASARHELRNPAYSQKSDEEGGLELVRSVHNPIDMEDTAAQAASPKP